MPVVATSPPIKFPPDEAPVVEPPVVRPPPITPPITREKQIISKSIKDFVNNHKVFINKVNDLPACFSRDVFPNYSDSEFEAHVEVANTDKYVTPSGDMYCSMQSIQNLAKALKRFQDE